MEAPTMNPPEKADVATSGFITCRRWKFRRQIHRRRAIWKSRLDSENAEDASSDDEYTGDREYRSTTCNAGQ
ncbi:hypothetical protein LINPERPRIM_LOCUS3861 [Linum perenne]